jgi:hypothetical protein
MSKNYGYLPAVKVVLQSFIHDMDIDANFDEVYGTAEINIEDGYQVTRSQEILDICNYLIANNLVDVFFKGE